MQVLSDYRATVRRLRTAAFLASAGAAAVHLGVAPAHLTEYLPAGLFMLACGASQLAWAFAIVRDRVPRWLVEAGVWTNAGIVALWITSRTAGVPFGAEPWVAEHVHGPDVLATGMEVIAIAAGALLLQPFLPRPSHLLISLAAAGALFCPVVGGDDPARERAIATATLLIAASARGLIVARARLIRRTDGRNDAYALHVTPLHVTRLHSAGDARGYLAGRGAAVGARG